MAKGALSNDYGSWRKELERMAEHVKEDLCLKSDNSGVFFEKIGSFSDFLLNDGKGKDPDVAALFDFFRRFRPDLCSPGRLKKSQEEIVGLCIKICKKFKE